MRPASILSVMRSPKRYGRRPSNLNAIYNILIIKYMMNLVIMNNIIQNMANNRKFYYSEADFQHFLAMALRSSGYDVYLEYPVKVQGKVYHIDIIAYDKETGLFHPIELKYKTKAMTCAGLCGNYQLRTHGAQDINRYLFWKDVQRIEQLKSRGMCECRIGEGYAIMLTNDPLYWTKPNSKSTYIDSLFRIHPGKTVQQVNWMVETNNGNISPDYKLGAVTYTHFSLSNAYSVPQWIHYSNVNKVKTNGASEFKFLTMAVI